jgi:hypothetical protein
MTSRSGRSSVTSNRPPDLASLACRKRGAPWAPPERDRFRFAMQPPDGATEHAGSSTSAAGATVSTGSRRGSHGRDTTGRPTMPTGEVRPVPTSRSRGWPS